MLAGPSPRYAPLGDLYTGVCTARGEPSPPGDGELRELCNLGYARGECPHFPDAHDSDAVRFAIAGDGGGLVRIQFCEERDHRPVRHGEFELAAAAPAAPGVLAAQARAYLGAYLRRRPARAKAAGGTT